MNRSYFVITLFVMALLPLSCSRNVDYSESMSFETAIVSYPDMFKQKLSLNSPEVLNFEIDQPESVSVQDSILIVSTGDPSGYWYFYDSKTFAFYGKFLAKGRASHEVLSSPRVSKQFFYEQGGDMYSTIYEFETGNILEMNITKTLDSGQIVIDKKDIGLEKFLFNVVKLDSESYFCREVDPAQTTLNRFIYSRGERTCPKYLAQINQSEVQPGKDVNNLGAYYTYNKDTGVIVEVPMDLRHINLYTLGEGSPHMSIMHENKLDKLAALNGSNSSKRIVAYNHVAGYKDFFVALYQGDTRKNVEECKARRQTLEFFDWMGMPVLEVEIDRRINSFDIDFENNWLYTVNYDSCEICRYDVSDLLKLF